jgi:hypothetical protein
MKRLFLVLPSILLVPAGTALAQEKPVGHMVNVQPMVITQGRDVEPSSAALVAASAAAHDRRVAQGRSGDQWTMRIYNARQPVTVECNGAAVKPFAVRKGSAVMDLSACLIPGRLNKVSLITKADTGPSIMRYEVLKNGKNAGGTAGVEVARDCAGVGKGAGCSASPGEPIRSELNIAR